MEGMRNISKISDGKGESLRSLGRSGTRWEGNVKRHLEKKCLRV
jgi:hypothetical protein